MQAVQFEAPNQVAITDVPRPEPGPGEALVQIKATTICGSDLKILNGDYDATTFPHIPGHEWAGTVVAVGSDVERIQVGDRVGNEPHVGCGECQRCMEGLYNLCEHYGVSNRGHAHIGFTTDGGLAEYVAVDTRALHHLRDGMSWDEGAFCENVGVALWALQRAGINPGDDVAVLGPGAIGHIAVQIARFQGAETIILTGTRDERLAPLSQLGGDHAININRVEDVVDTVRDVNGGPVDVAVEFAGSESAASQAIRMVRRGGDVVLGGSTSPGKTLRIDLREIVVGHKQIYGSVANPRWICERGYDLVMNDHIDVDPLITHRFPLTEFEHALDTFRNREQGAFRVMLYPEEDTASLG